MSALLSAADSIPALALFAAHVVAFTVVVAADWAWARWAR